VAAAAILGETVAVQHIIGFVFIVAAVWILAGRAQ
jgi:drug/metabolite transporter (DMT)-like permease